MLDKNYYYELRYVDNDTEVSYKFDADLDLTKLADHLKDFLKACSWYEKQVNELINGGTV